LESEGLLAGEAVPADNSAPLSDKETVHISKFLSLVLRHKPEELGVALDENGWTDVDGLLAKMQAKGWRIDRAALDHVVAANNKKRFAFDESGARIRASQGHSVEIDLAYEPASPPEFLYHGTGEKSLAAILRGGIEKRSRQHVHLSPDAATAVNVGRRHGKPVVLEVLASEMHRQGHQFFLSANGVWLTGHVPPEYLRQS
jgi:putative RNA 2'-phosphotransferase